MKLRDAVEQGAACQLMLDKQFWAGGHFYLLILFSHITINRWKHQNAFRTLCEQTCFEGLGSICICPCFAEYGVLYLCLMQALIFFPPFCVSLFSLERRPISAPGSCPLRFGCGTRPCDDEAGSREMSASRGKCVSCASLTSPAARRGWGGCQEDGGCSLCAVSEQPRKDGIKLLRFTTLLSMQRVPPAYSCMIYCASEKRYSFFISSRRVTPHHARAILQE